MKPNFAPLLFTGLLAASALADQVENAIDATAPQPIALYFGSHTTGAVISPSTNFDFYTLQLKSGETARVIVRSATNGFDPELRVLDPNAQPLPGASCDGGSSPFWSACTISTTITAAMNGSYTLIISDVAFDETGAYSIQVERILPKLTYPGVAYNSSIKDSISPTTDIDFYTFEAAPPSNVLLAFKSLTNGFDPVCTGIRSSGRGGSWKRELQWRKFAVLECL